VKQSVTSLVKAIITLRDDIYLPTHVRVAALDSKSSALSTLIPSATAKPQSVSSSDPTAHVGREGMNEYI
jgi:hypothetical protein